MWFGSPPRLPNLGDWQRWLMHSILNRDQAGSIPASPTKFEGLEDMDMHSGFHLRASRLHATPSPSVRARQRSRPAHPVAVTKVLRDWQIWICTRLLSETKQVRFLHPAPVVRCKRGFFQWDRIMPSKHGTPVRIRHPLPMWLCRSMGKDSRLRTEQLGFESSRGRHNRIAQAERALTS